MLTNNLHIMRAGGEVDRLPLHTAEGMTIYFFSNYGIELCRHFFVFV